MTNRQWVTLSYFFARQTHHISSHDQQAVSDTSVSFLCLAVSSIVSHPMTNREWVTLVYHFFARQSHKSYLIPWPTVCEWHCCISLQQSHPWPTGSKWHWFISLSGLINHVSSHDQQLVSRTGLFLCQEISFIMSHPTGMTNSWWVTSVYFSGRQSHQLCLIPWPIGSEWHWSISCHQAGLSIMSNSMWVTLVYFFAWTV